MTSRLRAWTQSVPACWTNLIVQLKESIGATVVMVTHELASIFDIATNSVYLDANTRTMIDYGDPRELRDHSERAVVRQFLARGTNTSTHGTSAEGYCMSEKPHTVAIGSFIVGALLIAISGLIFLGGSGFRQRQRQGGHGV